MAYRDDAESLRAYRDRDATDLEEARRAAQEASERAKGVAKLEKELAEAEEKLAAIGKARNPSHPKLEDVRVAAPCHVSWDTMVGDDRVRFCGRCEKNVYNLSAMPREEAEAFIADRAGNICVRLYKRTDGTVLTEDCPVGVKRRRRVRLAIAVGGGLMMGAGWAAASMDGKCKLEPSWHQGEIAPLQGVMAVDPPPSAAQEPSAEVPPPQPSGRVLMGKPVMKPHPGGAKK
jgi:hypothetical protein